MYVPVSVVSVGVRSIAWRGLCGKRERERWGGRERARRGAVGAEGAKRGEREIVRENEKANEW